MGIQDLMSLISKQFTIIDNNNMLQSLTVWVLNQTLSAFTFGMDGEQNVPKASGLFFSQSHLCPWGLSDSSVSLSKNEVKRRNWGIAPCVRSVHWHSKARLDEKWDRILTPPFLFFFSCPQTWLSHHYHTEGFKTRSTYYIVGENFFKNSPSIFPSILPLGLTLWDRTGNKVSFIF